MSVGIDIVDIARCERLLMLPNRILLRMFTIEELDYCRSKERYAAESLAIRFAAREAAYKACSSYRYGAIPLLTFSRLVSVGVTPHGTPVLSLDMVRLREYYAFPQGILFNLSLAHTATTAVAIVITSVV